MLSRGPVAFAFVLALLGWAGAASAQLRVQVTEGNLQPMPIAIPAFVGAGGGVDELSQNVAQVVTADLKRSGLFAPVDPSAFIERVCRRASRRTLRTGDR
jgi:TolB protein